MSLFAFLKRAPLNAPLLKAACACGQQNFFSAKAPAQGIRKEVDPVTGEVKTKKTPVIPKITLLSGDSLSVTTLAEAEHLSKRRDLKLVKIVDIDAKTHRPVYKLMTGAEYHAEDLKQRERKKKEKESAFIKGEKVLIIGSKIMQHDLETQLRKALKWLQKMYEVRFIINCTNMESGEQVFSSIEQFIKKEAGNAQFIQKRTVGSDISFQLRHSNNSEDDGNKDINDDRKISQLTLLSVISVILTVKYFFWANLSKKLRRKS